jgi:hypothetical protein
MNVRFNKDQDLIREKHIQEEQDQGIPTGITRLKWLGKEIWGFPRHT